MLVLTCNHMDVTSDVSSEFGTLVIMTKDAAAPKHALENTKPLQIPANLEVWMIHTNAPPYYNIYQHPVRATEALNKLRWWDPKPDRGPDPLLSGGSMRTLLVTSGLYGSWGPLAG